MNVRGDVSLECCSFQSKRRAPTWLEQRMRGHEQSNAQREAQEKGGWAGEPDGPERKERDGLDKEKEMGSTQGERSWA